MSRNSFALTIILLAVAIFLAVGAGIYFYTRQGVPTSTICTEEARQCFDGSYAKRAGPKCGFSEGLVIATSTSTKKQVQAVTSSQPILQIADSSSWPIYRNIKHGYELKYPQEARFSILAESSENPNAVGFDLGPVFGYDNGQSDGSDNNARPKLSMLVTSNANQFLTLEEWVDRETAPGHGTSIMPLFKKEFIVGGEPAYWAEFSGGGRGTGQYNMVLIFFIHGTVKYRIAGVRIPENPSSRRAELLAEGGSMPYVNSYEPVFDQMVASFKFIIR